MLASDVTALGQYTKEYFVLPEFHVAVLKKEGVELYDMSGEPAEPEWMTVSWDVDKSSKGGYPFYMERDYGAAPGDCGDGSAKDMRRYAGFWRGRHSRQSV